MSEGVGLYSIMAAGAPVGDKLLHQADLRLGQRNQHICLRLRAPVRRIRVLPAEPQGAGHDKSAGHGAVEFFVLPTKVLNEKVGGQKTIALSGVIKLGAKETDFAGLRNAILASAIVQ